MSVPKYNELYLPLLKAIADGADYSINDVYDIVAKQLKLSIADLAELLPSGKQTVFKNRLGWARTYLAKAGLVDVPSRAHVQITKEGKRVLREDSDKLDNEYLKRYESFRIFQNITSDSESDKPDKQDETPEQVLENAYTSINSSLADEILVELMNLSPSAFEQLVLDLMNKMGYGTFENSSIKTDDSGDEGIDGIIMQDKLGFKLIYIQAKRWAANETVGRPVVQAFVGAIAGKGGEGLIVTTSKFTKQAIDYARTQHVILMDGIKLANCMIEHDFGVSVRKTYQIKTLDSDLFDEYKV
ncbi:MAG: restriction endonuclease [Clostridiales bacterium]|nr:restriction endonuclease [Clostridiales bacterium]